MIKPIKALAKPTLEPYFLIVYTCGHVCTGEYKTFSTNTAEGVMCFKSLVEKSIQCLLRIGTLKIGI